MKKILIASAIVAAAAAGVIIYLRRRNSVEGQVEDAAGDAANIMDKNMRRVNRKVHHAMN